MRFFIPLADTPEQAQSVYSSIKEFLGKELGAVFSPRRVRSLSWVHDGKKLHAEVGKVTNANGETVIAILYEPDRSLYHVCTPNRGVARDMSILAGSASVTASTDFDME